MRLSPHRLSKRDSRIETPEIRQRGGTMLPAIIMAILVVCLLAALVFDRLWLDAARVQLRTAAEAAALAAAGRIASDDRLRADTDPEVVLESARRAAVSIAAENRVAGSPIRLDPTPGGDIRFGSFVDDPQTGRPVFLETDEHPSTVLVTAQAVRRRSNGVALFFRSLTGVASADVMTQAGATIDNAVIGVRPLPGSCVPGLPLGILASDPAGSRDDTWQRQITQGEGEDQYGFDETSYRVTEGPDGIREIVLRWTATAASSEGYESSPTPQSPNFQILDLGNGLLEHHVRRQIADGWSHEDLAPFGGQFILDGIPKSIDASLAPFPHLLSAFASVIGQPRVCLLYVDDGPSSHDGVHRLKATRLIAGRMLAIEAEEEASDVRIIFQPAVLTTRTVLLGNPTDRRIENPYICKIHITY
jgi:hypothetical protein